MFQISWTIRPCLTLSANILASRAAVWHSYQQCVVRDHSKIIKPALYFGPPDFIPTMQLLTLHSHDSKNRNKQNIIWKLSISRCKSLQFCPFKHSLLLLSCCRLLTSRRFFSNFQPLGKPMIRYLTHVLIKLPYVGKNISNFSHQTQKWRISNFGPHENPLGDDWF